MIWIIIAILNAWRLQGCERSNGRAEADYSLLQFPPSTHPSLLPSFPVKIFALPCTQPFSTVRSYDHTAKRERERQKVRGREEERRRKEKSLKAKKVKKKTSLDGWDRKLSAAVAERHEQRRMLMPRY